jgi:exopolyphosphatase/guanosine-5'-triphosphate,3'-diphosphate pyrophosphatase
MIGIDLGSNTLRIVEVDCRRRDIRRRFERIVRTAEGLHATGCIGEKAIGRIVAALKEAAELFDFSQPVAAVATEAIRRAANAESVLRTIEEATGVRFEAIDGSREAELTLLAVRRRLEKLKLAVPSFMTVDIGGASTELTAVSGDRVRMRSFSVGIVTAAEALRECVDKQTAIRDLMAPLAETAKAWRAEGFDAARFVATAGTPTTVAALEQGLDYGSYDPDRVNGTRLTRETLAVWMRRLLALDETDRARLVGVGREDLIVTGIMLFDAVFEALGVSEAVVVDDSLREGVAWAACESLQSSQRNFTPNRL